MELRVVCGTRIQVDPAREHEVVGFRSRSGPRIATLTDRVRHVVQSTSNGKRIVILSGGAKTADSEILDQVRAIRDGGGFGSIIGRNSFQRPKPEALKMLRTIMDIDKEAPVPAGAR